MDSRGCFEHGFSTELEFDGEAYAKKGVILATISYRDNVFGFLYDRNRKRNLVSAATRDCSTRLPHWSGSLKISLPSVGIRITSQSWASPPEL